MPDAHSALASTAAATRVAGGPGRRRALDLLDRQLQAIAPSQKWVADFTYLWTAEG